MNSIVSPKRDKSDSSSSTFRSHPSTSASLEVNGKLTGKRVSPSSGFKKNEAAKAGKAEVKNEGSSPLSIKDEDGSLSSSSPQLTHSDHPEEYLGGQWEVDYIQYCNFNPVTSRLNDSLSINTIDPKRMKDGAAYRNVADKDPSDYKCFRDERMELYRVGDFVYMDLDSSYPYVIGKVESFKMKKGTQMTIKVTRLYRREDLIADSQSLLDSERKEAGVVESNDEMRVRELFPSDVHLTQSVAVLKGKCQIVHLNIKNALQEGSLDRDVFFYCTSYSPDTGRLSACHPEIREGAKFQASCPLMSSNGIGDEPDRDQLVYKPGNMCAESEDTVVKFARTFRTTVLLENPHINELERTAFQGDRVKIDALDCLTRCGYVASDAVKQMMVDDKVFLEHTQFLSVDDTKKFVKGLRNYGKNFPKIVKEYLPSFNRDTLVHYYYWWKKSGDAFKPKKINGTTAKKPLFPQTKRPQRGGGASSSNSNSETQPFVDYDSASEDDEFGRGRACHHCYSLESQDWHHSGQLNQLLCTSCRHHFKRYGTMRDVERPKDIPRSLLHEEQLNGAEDGEEEGVKTRASNRRDRLKTPNNEEDRTPTKNGEDGERRSTPQRSVKSTTKRTYHPSTSSTDEALTPKKAKETKLGIKLKPVHQLALANNKLTKMEKQESVDSGDDQFCPNKAQTTNTSSSTTNNDPPSLEPIKKVEDEEDEDEDIIEEEEEDPIIEILNEHRLRVHPECFLQRVPKLEEDSQDPACTRTQIVFKCDDEPKWLARRKEQAEARQRLRKEEQAKKQMAEQEKEKQKQQEQESIRQLQQLAAVQQAANIGMRPPPQPHQDMMHPGMRLPTLPPNSMLRPPTMPPQLQPQLQQPDLMALIGGARPELLHLLLQQQQQQRPPMMMQQFGGGRLPPGLNPALLAQAPSNTLLYQMQSQAAAAQAQAQQQRMIEEQQKRQQQQQMEQREREQRQQLQQQMQNQQLLMAAMGLTPQMLAAGFPLGGIPSSIPSSIAVSSQSLQQQFANQGQATPQPQQLNQLDHLAQMLRGQGMPQQQQQIPQQQQQNPADVMQLLLRLQQQQDQQRAAQGQK